MCVNELEQERFYFSINRISSSSALKAFGYLSQYSSMVFPDHMHALRIDSIDLID